MSKLVVFLPVRRKIYEEELPLLATTVSLEYARSLVERLSVTDSHKYRLCVGPETVDVEDLEHDLQVGDVIISAADFGPRIAE